MLTKRKKLIRNKVEIENADMRIIKWERVWNDNREEKNWERERERGMKFPITASQTTKERKIGVIA